MNKSMIKLSDCLKTLYKMIIYENYKGRVCKLTKISDKVVIMFVKRSEEDNKDNNDELISELNNLIRIINTPKEELTKLREVFDDFKVLSSYINYAKLNNRETYQVIEFFINHNIDSGIWENAITVQLEVLKKLKFKTIDTFELIRMIRNGEIQDFFSRNEEKLTEKEKAQLDEIISRLPEFSINIEELSKNNLKFKEIIIDKLPNITLENIVDGLNILESLECSNDVITKIKLFLLSTYEKNLNQNSERIDDLELNDLYIDMLIPINKDKDGEIIKDEAYSQNIHFKRMLRSHNETLDIKSRKVEVTIEQKKYLTESDVRELKKYLRNFYDTYHMVIKSIPTYEELFKVVDCMEQLEEDSMSIKRYLANILNELYEKEDYVSSKEELVKLVSLFIRYKVSINDIYAFIKKYSIKFIKTYDNPIDEYLDRLEEISFYDESIKKDMDELYAMTLNTDEDNYKIITSMMKEYLDMINEKSASFSYEYNLAYKLK